MSDIIDDQIDSDDSANDTSDVGSDAIDSADEDEDDGYSDFERSSTHSENTPSVLSTTSVGSSDRDQPELLVVDKEVEEIFPSGIFQTQHYQEMKTEEFVENLTHKLMGRIRIAEYGGKDELNGNKEKYMSSSSSNYNGSNNNNNIGMMADEVQNALHQFRRTQKHLRLFNSLFSNAVRKLEKHRRQSHKELKKLDEQNQILIGKYKNELHECNVSLDLVSEQSKTLEEGLQDIGNETIQTGHILADVNSKKERANDIKRLLDFFNEFNRYTVKEFPKIMKEKKFRFRVFNEKKRLIVAVKIIQKLLTTIVPELDDLRNCNQGIRNVQTYYNYQHQYLLKKFSKALRKEDILIIKKKFNILKEIGATEKCETLFVLKLYNEFIGIEKTFVLPEDLQEDSSDDEEEAISRKKEKRKRNNKEDENEGEGEEQERLDDSDGNLENSEDEGDGIVLDDDEISDGYEKDIVLINELEELKKSKDSDSESDEDISEDEEFDSDKDEIKKKQTIKKKELMKQIQLKKKKSKDAKDAKDAKDSKDNKDKENSSTSKTKLETNIEELKKEKKRKKEREMEKEKSKNLPKAPKEFDEAVIKEEERVKEKKRDKIRKQMLESKKKKKQAELEKKIEEQTNLLNQMLIEKEKETTIEFGKVSEFPKILKKIQKICFPYKDMIEKVFGVENLSKVCLRVFETVMQRVLNKTVENIFKESKNRAEQEASEIGNYVSSKTPIKKLTSFPESSYHSSSFSSGKEKLMRIEKKKIIEEEIFLEDFSKIYEKCQDFVVSVTSKDSEDCIGVEKSSLFEKFENLFKQQKDEYIDREKTLQDLISKVIISESTRIVKHSSPSQNQNKGKQKNKRGSGSGGNKKDKRITMMSPMRGILGGDKMEIVIFEFEKMLKVQSSNRNALKRCVLLSSKEELVQNVIEIFEKFINFGHSYMVRGLQCSVKSFKISSKSPFEPPPTKQLFDDICLTFVIMSRIEQHMKTDVLNRLGGSYLNQSKCWKLRHELFSTLEIQIEKGLKLIFTRIVTYSGNCLKKYYNKNDYCVLSDRKKKSSIVEDDDSDFMAVVTCSKYVKETMKFLKNQYSYIDKALFHTNKSHFLEKMGLKFYKQLIRFIQKNVKVSQTLSCSMKFKRDIEEFRDFFAKFESVELNKKFEVLRSLCGIVSVIRDNVESVVKTMKEEENIKKQLILIFVKIRTDVKLIKFKTNLSVEFGF